MKLIDRLSPENRERIEGIRDMYPATHEILMEELTHKEWLQDLSFRAVTMLSSHLELGIRLGGLYRAFEKRSYDEGFQIKPHDTEPITT